MHALRLASPEQLTEPAALASVTGPIRSLERSPLRTVGFTASRHERLDLELASGERMALVVKRTRLAADWTAGRTRDRRGREAALLEEPALRDVWSAFACPYVAYAVEDGEIAVLMRDLTPHLFADVREPLADAEEGRLLGALAALHARLWSSPALALPWLARPEDYAAMLDVSVAADATSLAAMPEPMRINVRRGWDLALERLPPAARELVAAPAAELAFLSEGVPWTLVHGDAKVANFALLPDGRVAAFDWAVVGAAPATVDIGWYLAVNATRLVGTKDETLRRYRRLLAASRATSIPDALWARLERVAIVAGARLLLWSKALAADAQRPGASAEWAWWAERLQAASE